MEDSPLNMTENKSIHWFRQDLRIEDNLSLSAASKAGSLIPVYILDDINSKEFSMGAASKWWLFQSLKSLNDSLNGNLHIFKGDPKEIFEKITSEHEINHISWNRCYEPWRIQRDKELKNSLELKNIHVESFSGSLLWEPWNISKDDGTPYRVFTPFYKKGCLNSDEPRLPIDAPDINNFTDCVESDGLESLNLLPEINWYKGFEDLWSPGEIGANRSLDEFLEEGLLYYKAVSYTHLTLPTI